MTDPDQDVFDQSLLTAAFQIAAAAGWRRVNPACAAVQAGLDAGLACLRFPSRISLLVRLNGMADQAALSLPVADGAVRADLFDRLMRRFDLLQTHRAGVLALMRALPTDPAALLALGALTLRSMAWILNHVGVHTADLAGPARVAGLTAAWSRAVWAWRRDENTDLSLTMAALDKALGYAEKTGAWRRADKTVAEGHITKDETPLLASYPRLL